MSTRKARECLDDNLTKYLNSQKDPVMWNLCTALKEISKAIDDLESKVDKLD